MISFSYFDKWYEDMDEREVFIFLDKKMIGTVRGEIYNEEHGYLEDLYISREYRGNNYGALLLKEIEKYLLFNTGGVVLTVEQEKESLIKWYENHGYTISGKTKKNKIILEKSKKCLVE